MSINRFAILTDGFDSPAVHTGVDWSVKVGRALLVACGYLNIAFSSATNNLAWSGRIWADLAWDGNSVWANSPWAV